MRAMKGKMPGLAQQRIESLINQKDGIVSSSSGLSGFWSKQRDTISYNQLQKFWTGLSPKARQELLKIDKQTFFEQARKNTYCSRCNGLLLESFVQIVLYGKSVQQGAGATYNSRALKKNEGECVGHGDEMVDPSVHPWGGLTTTRDGLLSLLDCYLYSKSLKGLQNVFDGARARERGREMLYPDACGGEGRGWISQRIANYGRGHGPRETCALHTARLSCDTLVDFWSALGEETQHSLLRIKEEDFTEKLMFRFENKRFCRDCRKNVIREFKELKELKRLRWETRCTTSFCCPDAAFQYEVSHDTVQADWRQTFGDTAGSYHHFEWAVGSGDGKSDIVEFKSVGRNGSVRISGLDLRGLNVCFITLRAWRLDGRCSELSVKANALKGSQRCVHCRLVVGDGYVSITRGESIRMFFEHAEEAEEEEDDDSVNNDENDPDGEYSRPLKHAKSPELAREFLLDAATVIFKEQVEKAFREGTARQNAHSIFVCLAIKLLEERVHVACKEIITLEKQMKLVEEEEREKREEEERKERKRTKEREKKQRRKERIKGKEKDKEKGGSEPNIISSVTDATMSKDSAEDKTSNDFNCSDSATETVHTLTFSSRSPEPPNRHAPLTVQSSSYAEPDEDNGSVKGAVGCFTVEQSQSTHQAEIFQKDAQLEQPSKCSEKRQYLASSNNASVASGSELRCHGDNSVTPSRTGHGLQHQVNRPKSSVQSRGPKYNLNIKSGNERSRNRYENDDCNCNQISQKYRAKAQSHVSGVQPSRAPRAVSKSESALNITKQFYHGKYRQTEYSNASSGRPKSRGVIWSNSSRNFRNSNEVWEPLEPKKYPRSNSDSNVTIGSSGFKKDVIESDRNIVNSPNGVFSNKISAVTCEKNVNSSLVQDPASRSIPLVEEKNSLYSKESDNISWPSGGGGSTSTSNNGYTESSATSDSEDASQMAQIPGGKESSTCGRVGFSGSHDDEAGAKNATVREHAFEHKAQLEFSLDGVAGRLPGDQFTQAPHQQDARRATLGIGPVGCQPQHSYRLDNSDITYPLLQAHSAMGYYQQPPVSWPPAPAGGFLPHSHHNQYAYGGPLGHGPNENSNFFLRYDPLHSIGSPLFSPQLPVCRPSTATNFMTSEEKYQNFQSGVAVQQADGSNVEKAVAGMAAAMGGPSIRDVGRNNRFARSQDDDSNFSLFHCGIPANISARDEMIGKFSSKFSSNHAVDDRTCNKESPGGEYNLFSSSSIFKISLF